MAVPYPAGLITKKPGRTINMMCCNQSGCTAYAYSMTFGYGGGAYCCGAFMAGSGMPSASSCGASVNCGLRNTAGKVRITYS